MIGEYILHFERKNLGGIYDDRFFVKPVKLAIEFMHETEYDIPYDDAKEMLLVDDVDSRDYLMELLNVMYEVLPVSKVRKKKRETPLNEFERLGFPVWSCNFGLSLFYK